MAPTVATPYRPRQAPLEPGGKLTLVHVFSGSTRPIDAVTPGMVEEDRARRPKLLEEERTATSVDAELLARSTR